MSIILFAALAGDPSALPVNRSPIPKGRLERLFSDADYPPAAVAAHHEGITGVRLYVGEIGRVDQCKVIDSSGFALLDQVTCSILARRARFVPATDVEGRPVSSLFDHQVVWKLP